MEHEAWEPFRTFSDRGSADALAALLESEGVPVRVESGKLVAAVERDFRVLVPQHLVHRARWIAAQSEFTDPELDYLATGKLGESE